MMRAFGVLVLFLMAGPAFADTPEERIAAAGHTLPEPVTPVANYVTWRKSGNLLFLSGHGDCIDPISGKVGDQVDIERAYKAAQHTALCMLATMKSAVGDLDKIWGFARIDGMVNAVPDFGQQPQVVNGFSDLMVVAFGDNGKGARAAVGMGSLPRGIPVEISALAILKD